ncbi:HutD family protein [Roseateles sp. BYS180W]|uniref:HutD family protein n=1 Tax=Roseateles rivi TaxID=3299028 RepID=A0ABW7FVB9_9BURK
MSWSQSTAAAVTPTPWRNGGGVTRELLAWPHPADWVLRLSVAEIAKDGPFSAFPGIDRWFAVLSGAGVALDALTLRVGDALHAFDGAAAPHCRLLDGVTEDFNLMHHRGAGHVLVSPALPGQPQAVEGAAWMGLFTAQAGVLVHGARRMPLAERSLSWCEAPAEQPCVLHCEPAVAAPQAWWMRWWPQGAGPAAAGAA